MANQKIEKEYVYEGLGFPIVDSALLREFEKNLFLHKPQDSADALFKGFVPFQKDLVEHFFSEATKALANKC